MRQIIFAFGVMFLLTSCTTHLSYIETVKDLQAEAKSKFGQDHEYVYHVMVGDERIWRNVSCKKYQEGVVDGADSSNTFVFLDKTPVNSLRLYALKKCEKNIAGNRCLPIVEMGECILDKYLKNSPSKEKSNQLTEAKNRCDELGFSPNSEKFGTCVLKLLEAE